MAIPRITVTYQFTEYRAQAKIICQRCRHFTLVSGPVIDLMFPTPMPLHMAEKRLRCSKCGTKGKVWIETLLPAGR